MQLERAKKFKQITQSRLSNTQCWLTPLKLTSTKHSMIYVEVMPQLNGLLN